MIHMMIDDVDDNDDSNDDVELVVRKNDYNFFFVGHDLVKLVRDDARSINSDPSGKLMNLFHVNSCLFGLFFFFDLYFLDDSCIVLYRFTLIFTMCITFLIK